jgi:hypothetical protein
VRGYELVGYRSQREHREAYQPGTSTHFEPAPFALGRNTTDRSPSRLQIFCCQRPDDRDARRNLVDSDPIGHPAYPAPADLAGKMKSLPKVGCFSPVRSAIVNFGVRKERADSRSQGAGRLETEDKFKSRARLGGAST